MQKRESHPVSVVARLRPEVDLPAAIHELNQIAAELAVEHPSTNRDVGVVARTLLEDYIGNVRVTMWVLLVAAALVLAIGCANVANILLGRSASRSREIATRMALGAGRGRIVRQLLTESLLLAAAGGMIGLLSARWSTAVLSTLAAQTLPRVTEVSLDWRVVAFSTAVTAVAGLSFGLAPAWHIARHRGSLSIAGNARTVAGVGRVREILVVAEVAVSLALLVTAGLLLRSFSNITHVDTGYDPHDVLTFRLRLADAEYRATQQVSATLHEQSRASSRWPVSSEPV